MNETKLNGLINSLLTMADTDNLPFKYNQVIAELLQAERHIFTILNHCGKPVVSYINETGGISTVCSKQSQPSITNETETDV